MENRIHASLSLLTWKSPETLRATLTSLAPIAEAFQDRLVLCQEGHSAEIALALDFGYRAQVTTENLGILGGLKEAVLRAKCDPVLLLENDAHFLGTAEDIDTLTYIAKQLSENKVDFACLMDRRKGPRPRYFKYWKKTWPPQRKLTGLLRPATAEAIKADAIALMPEGEQSCDFAKTLSQALWQTSSHSYMWSNRAKFVSKSFFLQKLTAFAQANPTERRVNGLIDLEHQINAPQQRHWYRKQAFDIILHKTGLFGHARYDRPDNDEKWETGIPLEE